MVTFYNILLLFCVSICTVSCRNPYIKQEKLPIFTTTEDSKLYFKNVRQIFYNRDTDETQREMFRLKKSVLTDTIPIINLCIINHWKQDKAFLLLEPNAWFLSPDTIRVVWKDANNARSGTYFFEQGSIDRHHFFALQIYEAILQEYDLFIQHNQQQVPFLNNKTAREAFRITVKDYLKLTNQTEHFIE